MKERRASQKLSSKSIMDPNQNVKCKIVVVGDSQCGKTALLHVFAKDCFPEVSGARRRAEERGGPRAGPRASHCPNPSSRFSAAQRPARPLLLLPAVTRPGRPVLFASETCRGLCAEPRAAGRGCPGLGEPGGPSAESHGCGGRSACPACDRPRAGRAVFYPRSGSGKQSPRPRRRVSRRCRACSR